MISQLQETHLCKANKRNQLLKAWSQLEPHNCEVDKKGRFYIYVGTPEAECKRLITPGLYDPFQKGINPGYSALNAYVGFLWSKVK
ncbi:MAG: hypothetical protein KME46_29740 [Brasilonema angustatum HA4187-MV1]|jgi:hypothetical protein|nr:hypothetical protein [Brasilonema angustatum HA4187-MV1]